MKELEKSEWKEVNWDFFEELAKIHNLVCFKEKEIKEFNDFVLQNKEKINNPIYLNVFSEQIELHDEQFFENNFEMCKVFYDFMQENANWIKVDYGFRGTIRLKSFEDSFKNYLSKR